MVIDTFRFGGSDVLPALVVSLVVAGADSGQSLLVLGVLDQWTA